MRSYERCANCQTLIINDHCLCRFWGIKGRPSDEVIKVSGGEGIECTRPHLRPDEWLNVDEGLPKPFEIVWIYWRDRQVLLGCRTYEDEYEFTTPSHEGWYSLEDEKTRWTHYWKPYRIDKPNPPTKKEHIL